MGLVPDPLADQPDEVLRAAGQLEADQVGAEQALEDLPPPRQLLEELGRRERDVQEEPDVEVGSQLAEHLRHQLQLVVVHPDGRALGRPVGGVVGEAPVHRDVRLPPLAVELRLGDDVVVERPEGRVGEALVEPLDLLLGQRDRVQSHAVVVEGLQAGLGAARPADPDAVVGAHHRLDRGDQATGRRPPLRLAVGARDAVDRQPVGDDHEVRGHSFTLGAGQGPDLIRRGGLTSPAKGASHIRAGRVRMGPRFARLSGEMCYGGEVGMSG